MDGVNPARLLLPRRRETAAGSIGVRGASISSGSSPIPLFCDGVLARRRIFHDQPVKGPLASCGRFGFASR
ncbi:hypothetical protein EXN32_11980 [Agrobacterium tumefaciens]|uniref:Uncharacterized protein n=2 Tax=Rhizobium/Agrobacterium group TaxID=227290 RepID=A0A2Z2PQ12_RHIRH|nr:hypothetical protein [Rhizobium rhizogenes]TRB03302.1 hypothetical protein EXN61_23595 [Agrobacterium tumefaciens]TRB16683.1 hypothetical protein EXN32_11980 [Agrobacterium tumefaciens]